MSTVATAMKTHAPYTALEGWADVAHPDSLRLMVERGGRWAVYQNADLHSFPDAGHVKFLQFGAPHNTYPTAESLPPHYPADSIREGVNYTLRGEMDVSTNQVVPLYAQAPT